MREIDFPLDVHECREFDMPAFQKLRADAEDMEYMYTHKVRYTDLDKTGHMTNLKYVDLFLNAFDSKFFDSFSIREFELHFLNQCFENESIHVYRKAEDKGIRLTAVNDDKMPCATAYIL